MITVFLSWCYIFIICFLLGMGIYTLVQKLYGEKDRMAPVSMLVVLGIVGSTVYTEYLSCFMKIGALAHLILMVLAVGCGIWLRKTVIIYGKQMKELLFSWEGLFYLGVAVFIAFFASRGEFHTDTNIYHAQNIRIYEEYGLLKGMGNLQQHFAYNSSYLAFAAIFSMKWLLGQSLHTTTGFLEIILCIYAFYGLKRFRSHKTHLADFMKLAIPFYVLIILIRSMSPATDFGTMLLVLYVLCAWCDNLEGEKSIFVYYLLALLSVFIATMKFSACFMVLLALYPGIILLKKKCWKQVLVCILTGTIMMLPFLLRNMLISGWLLYPFAGIDLFNVRWKIPKEYLLQDAAQIKVWGRCLYDVQLENLPVTEWMPYWWEGQERYEKMFLGSVVMGTLLLVVQFLRARFRREQVDWGWTTLLGVVYANIAVWFFVAPFIRYGVAFLLAVPLLAAGRWIVQDKKGLYGMVTGGLVFCIVACLSPDWDRYITDGRAFLKQHAGDSYYLRQQDYDAGEMAAVEINGVTIYYDNTFKEINSYFTCPGTCYKTMLERSTLMGDTLKEGFMPK